jgi:peroxiredoxin
VSLLLILPWLIVAAGCWIGFHLVQQNGRILLRLDALEKHISRLGALSAAATAPIPLVAQSALPVGTAAPDFELPDLLGGRQSLAAFRGQRVLFISFSPQCGYCMEMAAELAELPVDGRDGTPIPIVVTTGDAEENRRLINEHHICCVVLLQNDDEVVAAYGLHGTPMGYLIDEAGRIGSEVAIGAKAIFALAHDGDQRATGDGSATEPRAYHGNRTLADSRINRDGLRSGTPAPDFTLPLLDSGELSLSDFRGHRVLLVLSDPRCGPCMQQLAPHLEAFHRRTPDLKLLIVSRGDIEENRRRVIDLGLTFPVVLQKQWEISRQFAMFATPAGYLIDEDGVIGADVAVGVQPILDLASRAASRPSR